MASSRGHVQIVRFLLADQRVDPSADNDYAIRYASRNGYTGVVRLLLSNEKVDPSVNSNEAMLLASENEHLEIVQILLSEPRVDSSIPVISFLKRSKFQSIVEILRLYSSKIFVNQKNEMHLNNFFEWYARDFRNLERSLEKSKNSLAQNALSVIVENFKLEYRKTKNLFIVSN